MKAPIKNFNVQLYPKGSVTQYFGENKELYSRVVCRDDKGSKYCLDGHNGIDIVAPWGTPIYAVEDGLVVTVKNSPTGFGKYVRTAELVVGHEWTYGHLSRIDVEEGQAVKTGDQIGLMGNTGFVVSGDTPYWKNNPYAGTHLHLGLRRIANSTQAPRTTYGNGLTVHVKDWRNGFFGAVDPLTFYKETDEERRQLLLTIRSLANQTIQLLQQLIKLKS